MHVQLIFLSIFASAWTVAASRVWIEKHHEIPEGWRFVRPADPDKQVQFRVALAQPNIALFERTLYEVSTPGHPRYGAHLTRRQVKDLVRASDETIGIVRVWLQESGIREGATVDDGEWISFNATVQEAEVLLNTTFSTYEHEESKSGVVRTLQYSVPAHVAEHVTTIQPTTRFGRPAALRRLSPIRNPSFVELAENPQIQAEAVPPIRLDVTTCRQTITPDCLRALYKIGNYQSDPAFPSKLGVCGYIGVGFQLAISRPLVAY